ncbi:MAG: DUF2243 domain-containing protein [Leptolyngbya sp. Prado105]|jgi:uncharacterized membrane protein|nr:DUF2243 domain-containing protein [Leptolyngbya sp. Prado105]
MTQALETERSRLVSKQFMLASILLGMGFAGFFDGIVLHQILQWHHMLSSVRPMLNMSDVKIHSVADGLFHLADYGFTIAGVTLLWQSHLKDELPKSSQPFIGLILFGAGLFNLLEGLIDHEILGIHHVHSGTHYLLWDIGFLMVGIGLMALGLKFVDRWKSTSESMP